MTATARAWTLKQRPKGMPTDADFELKEQPLAPLGEGEVRVRNHWLSVDPYMRGRMNDVKSYTPPFQLGEPMEGGAVGLVIESRSDALKEGDLVQHMLGWRDVATAPAQAFTKMPDTGVEDHHWLGNLGLTGGTAYWGLLDAAEAKEGETVFVSAAAGAVGSAVVQIAKAKGMTVIGSAGGADKCAWVKELGADAVIDYKAGPVLKGLAGALQELGKNGIDVYFDNVGGDHLDAALATARNRARIAICGLIEGYNSSEPTCLRYLARTIAARITIRGFLFPDYLNRMGEFYAEMGPWLASGKVRSRETVHEGLDKMPEAFLGLFSGSNIGKMLVRL
jgi:NADPH-dependent curcumin reductase CurA